MKDKILALQGHYGSIQNISKETFEKDFEKSCNRNMGRTLALQRDTQQSRVTVTAAEMLFLSVPPQPPPTWRLHVLKNVH